MKKFILTVVLLVGAAIYWAFTAPQQTVNRAQLTDLLEQGETVIDLTEVTKFEWTQVDAFGPYTTTDMIEEAMDISIRFGGGEVLESDFELVFANDERKLSSVTLSRKYGDYSVQDNRYLVVKKP